MNFEFLDYHFNKNISVATFRYQGASNIIFTETVDFAPSTIDYDPTILNAALFLAFIAIGTSYYKIAPTSSVILPYTLDNFSANYFNQIYQEGLSQFAFENHLTRNDLAHFPAVDSQKIPTPHATPTRHQPLVLVSGGKDSLLLYEKLRPNTPQVIYITPSKHTPKILDQFDPLIIHRHLDLANLKAANGLSGHVPITLINETLAIIQAILIGCDSIALGIGREGIEPHAYIDDLAVNHQWSKTPTAQNLFKTYLGTHITTSIHLNSPLEDLTELDIAREFATTCWGKYGHDFSSCNVANYKQTATNRQLKWCGKCAKCANSYLLFAPFIYAKEQKQLFGGQDLFRDPDLTEIFKGLLGVDNAMKPFECIASVAELREAYHHRLPDYGELPFVVD